MSRLYIRQRKQYDGQQSSKGLQSDRRGSIIPKMSRTLIFLLVVACLAALVVNNAEAQPGGFYGGRCRCRRYRCRRWERYSGRCYGGGGGGYNNWNMGGGGGGWGRRVRCCRRGYGGGGWD